MKNERGKVVHRGLGRITTGWAFGSLLLVAVGVVLCGTAARAQDAGAIVGWGPGVTDVTALQVGFVAVAGGNEYSLGLKADGSIVAWGDNGYGQCNVPAPNSGFVAIAGGYYHSLGLKADGSIVAWGRNNYGQCNVPAPNSGFVAVAAGFWYSLGLKADGSIVAWGSGPGNPPAPNSGFVAVAGGGYHSLGLKADGSIVAWGAGACGQTGWPHYGQSCVPAPNSGFVAVAGGYTHSLGLKSDGSIVAWGWNYRDQCTVPAPNSDFVAVAGGCYHSLGLKADGSIVAWGSPYYGQCNVPAPNSGFVAVAGGYHHSLGLEADGSIVAWGYNWDGQCNVPAPNSGFVAVAGGWYHSLGLKADGSIVAWGNNFAGQCNVPASNSNFVAVAGGGYFSLGLKADGSIMAWGSNTFGQCTVPAPNSGFVAVAGGAYHSLGLKADGSIVAWGDNQYSQCNVTAPNSGFVAVAGGGYHSLGLKADGSIVAWGANWYGQCDVPAPNSGFVVVAAGWLHSLGLKADGSIVAWGYNEYGQCSVPAPNSGFAAVAAGYYHSLGLLGSPQQPPVAAAGGPYRDMAGEKIIFNASNSYDLDGSIVGYRWDWTGDGTWDTDWTTVPTTSYTYNAEFHGHALLQVQDNDGYTASALADVDIERFFVHLTDPHVIAGLGTDRWTNMLNTISDPNHPLAAKPAFVLCTGDLTEWGGDALGMLNMAAVAACLDGLPGAWGTIPAGNIPIAFCPGNHDSRFWDQVMPPYSLYFYQVIINPELYFHTLAGNCAVFSIDTGYDYWPYLCEPIDLPEGVGLDPNDVNSLSRDLDALDGVQSNTDTSDYIKIIMLHHLYRGPDWCDGSFALFRSEFKEICQAFNVDYVVCGHTHGRGQFNLDGDLWDPSDGTRVFVTGSVRVEGDKRKIPIVHAADSGWTTCDPGQQSGRVLSTINVFSEGKVDLRLWDREGNWTGLGASGELVVGIPLSSYSRWQVYDPNTAIDVLFTEAFAEKNDTRDYCVTMEATEPGLVSIRVDALLQNGVDLRAFYNNVPMLSGSVGTLTATQSICDYVVHIQDPDGTERQVSPSAWEGNLPAGQPAGPAGPTSGFTGLVYQYSTYATDPEGDPVFYRFDWGDNTLSDWLGPFASGVACVASHQWPQAGTYDARAAAKDEWDHMGERSEPLIVTIAQAVLGDLNCDGAVDFGDINPFVLFLSNFSVWQQTYAGCPAENGDINDDGLYPDFGDINPFVALLAGR